MVNPCKNYCYEIYGLEYDPERCDANCLFAQVVNENQELKEAAKEAKWVINFLARAHRQ